MFSSLLFGSFFFALFSTCLVSSNSHKVNYTPYSNILALFRPTGTKIISFIESPYYVSRISKQEPLGPPRFRLQGLSNVNPVFSRENKYWTSIDPHNEFVGESINQRTFYNLFSFPPETMEQNSQGSFVDHSGGLEGRSGINRLQQTYSLDDIQQPDYLTAIQDNIGDTTEDMKTRLPIYLRQQGLFSFLNPSSGSPGNRPQGLFSFLNPSPGPPVLQVL